MKPLIVGLVGKKLSGKDTCYSLLESCASGLIPIRRFAFADTLKREVATAFGSSVEAINRDKSLYRQLLQAWGVARREIVGADYWINKTAEEIARHSALINVITDVRFLNEASFVRHHDGILVSIVRKEGESSDTHISEIELESIDTDYVLFNSTLEAFGEEVQRFWNDVLRPNIHGRLCQDITASGGE